MKLLRHCWMIILPFLIAFHSCKKNENMPVYISDEYKNYFNWQAGTYWVYYDSLTGDTDSIIVSWSRTRKPFQLDGKQTDPLEDIWAFATEYTNDTPARAWTFKLLAPDKFSVDITNGNYGNNITTTVLSGNPVSTGRIDNYRNCYLLPLYDDGGNNYTNIYSSVTEYAPYWKLVFNVSLDQGIVSMAFTGTALHPASLHLIRYHIVK